MKLFDVAIYSDQRSETDFANLAWFDVKRVLTVAHAPRRFQTAEELWYYLEHLVVGETDRLSQQGLVAHAVVGVHPGAIPERSHEEIWLELPWLLKDPKVLALGELGLERADEREWRAVRHQLEIMVEHEIDKPIIFSLPATMDTRQHGACLEEFAGLVREVGIGPERVLVLRANWLMMDQIEAEGFWSGLLCGPQHLSAREVVRVVQHHDRTRIVLGSGLSAGPADVLALPKLAFSLSEAGFEAHDIERLIYGNALRLFGLGLDLGGG